MTLKFILTRTLAAIFLLAIPVGALAALIAFLSWASEWECSAKASAMKIPYTYGIMQGCIVQYRGEWVPIEAVGVRTIVWDQP